MSSISAPNRRAWVVGPPGQVAAPDPGREAQVVLDPGALPGLAPDGLPLDEHRLQALGAAVDGGAQPGGAAAHHDEVVEREVGRRSTGPGLRPARPSTGAAATGPSVMTTNGRSSALIPLAASRRLRLRVALELHPAERAPGCGRGSPSPRARAPTSGGRRPGRPRRTAGPAAFQSSRRSSMTG